MRSRLGSHLTSFSLSSARRRWALCPRRLVGLFALALALAVPLASLAACSNNQNAGEKKYFLDEELACQIVREELSRKGFVNYREDVELIADAFDGKTYYVADFSGEGGAWNIEVASSEEDDIAAWNLDFYPEIFEELTPLHRRIEATGDNMDNAIRLLRSNVAAWLNWIYEQGLR